VPTYTAGTLPNCNRCEGQPGTDQFCGYDINTNYYEDTPITCNVVTYEFELTNTTFSPDGIERLGLVVNGQMPGPAIKASWGDTVVVTVKNSLQNNGTSIHFHGVRQLDNNMNDGVPSITQCPIAPGESMTYTWVAENYGTSWYHSHFAIQTWEGVFGPIIIDGPTSAPYDVDLGTYMLQDWTHATVDSMYDLAQNATPIPGSTSGATFGGPQTMDNGLINGQNTWNDDGALNTTVGSRLEAATFTAGQSYLLRLINSAIQSTLAFSIDGHSLTVISTDFVPIEPYTTDVLHINIGQRYNVIVNANASSGNYWMRADNQQSCTNMIQNRDVKAIIRYSDAPTGVDPTSTAWNYTDACVDEPYASLVPVVPLNAGPANFTEGALDVVIQGNSAQLYKWYLSGTTFFSEYNDPTLYDIYQNNSVPNYSGNLLVEVPGANEMVYVIVESPIPLPHPLHLHGHGKRQEPIFAQI
jgi:FtsP/CotA-like multicopper oxidase with cupredoxin domain